MKIYNKSLSNTLKIKFNGYEIVEKNFSQAYQDIFILMALNGKRNGTFVEIGAMDGQAISNTFLIEQYFNWTGISIDIDDISESFKKYNRKSNLIIQNALNIDYKKLFEINNMPKNIDYLQLDIEPPENTLKCLKKIPFDDYHFSVITYETEAYYSNPQIKKESRSILKSYGYELLAGNICNHGNDPFEDWYVNPKFIDNDIILKLKNLEDSNLTPDKILLNE